MTFEKLWAAVGDGVDEAHKEAFRYMWVFARQTLLFEIEAVVTAELKEIRDGTGPERGLFSQDAAYRTMQLVLLKLREMKV